eukprot:11982465-Heterocapsa_arctica.AAC.1
MLDKGDQREIFIKAEIEKMQEEVVQIQKDKITLGTEIKELEEEVKSLGTLLADQSFAPEDLEDFLPPALRGLPKALISKGPLADKLAQLK